MSNLKKYDRNSIVFFESKYNDVFTTSKDIADSVGLQHHAIQQLITTYKNDFETFGIIIFTHFKCGKRGRPIKQYLLNEQQATLLMTYLKNTEIVRKFKVELVSQFYQMREILREKKTQDWEFQRIATKTTRKLETEQIKLFVEYAKEQGSLNADRYYVLFSNLANKYADVNNRDFSNFKKLKNLEIIESVINKEIVKQISENIEYHLAYIIIKNKVEMVSEYL